MFRSRRRFGVTLLELLTVIGIIGVLCMLILPAVSAVRAASQRSVCAARLSQIGVALQNYESTHGWYPSRGARGEGLNASPQARLLSFLERSDVFDRLNWDLLPPSQSSPQNATAAGGRIAAFLCPADSHDDAGANIFACVGRGPYWLSSANGIVLRGNDGDAFFAVAANRKSKALVRGSSHVAAFSERVQGDGESPWMDVRRDILVNGNVNLLGFNLKPPTPYLEACRQAQSDAGEWAQHFSDAGGSWMRPEAGFSAYTHAMTPNSRIMDCGAIEVPVPYGAVTARSFHSGGVNVLFADGRVEFVGDSIDAKLWSRMSVISEAGGL